MCNVHYTLYCIDVYTHVYCIHVYTHVYCIHSRHTVTGMYTVNLGGVYSTLVGSSLFLSTGLESLMMATTSSPKRSQ